MLTPTHLLTAQTTYFATCIAVGHAPQPAEALLALGAALLPDLDSRQSYLGRLLRPVSSWFEDSFGHRTLTHSVLAQIALGIAAYFTLPSGFFLAFVSGWVSHSIADMMTPSGVAWFWPSRVRCVLPGNARYRMEVMGKGEHWFLGIMGVAGVLLLPLASTGQNTTGLIRSAIGDIAKARQEYDARKGDYAFYLETTGKDNQSYADVSGSYYVIGPYQETGFLLETDEGTRSVCRATNCD
ncbi:MAG: metal-dependent hydrolase [Thiotrichales bacterium]